jgi:hypothetical protein
LVAWGCEVCLRDGANASMGCPFSHKADDATLARFADWATSRAWHETLGNRRSSVRRRHPHSPWRQAISVKNALEPANLGAPMLERASKCTRKVGTTESASAISASAKDAAYVRRLKHRQSELYVVDFGSRLTRNTFSSSSASHRQTRASACGAARVSIPASRRHVSRSVRPNFGDYVPTPE